MTKLTTTVNLQLFKTFAKGKFASAPDKAASELKAKLSEWNFGPVEKVLCKKVAAGVEITVEYNGSRLKPAHLESLLANKPLKDVSKLPPGPAPSKSSAPAAPIKVAPGKIPPPPPPPRATPAARTEPTKGSAPHEAARVARERNARQAASGSSQSATKHAPATKSDH